MGLGFSVEALLPQARGAGPLRMGLARLDEEEWLWPEFDEAERGAVFRDHPQSVVVMPGAESAAREAAAATAGCGDLGEAASRIWEDLCVLEDDGTGTYRLTAAALGFPTDWRLEDKLGLPLTAIHAPIHGYAEQLASGVDHFFRELKPGPIFARSNWFIVANANWRYLPEDDPAERFAHVTSANAGDTLFARCERQTLRRLPQTSAVLFTIGIACEPLGRLSQGAVCRIADASGALSSGEHERRAVPHYAAALAGWAASRETGDRAAA